MATSSQPTNKELLLLTIQKLDSLTDTVSGLSADMRSQANQIHTIERKQSADCEKISAIKEDVKDKNDTMTKRVDGLEVKVNSWSLMNSAGTFIAAILGYLGFSKGP